ncbi:hypothetical protein [Psychromonas antarctica]|uniref:hypothetical protein n=1 Tax=Psychromonas antarctica TaxID=67573 RepID=UPI001EE7DA1D|nr:hypothetical protein [Psychromonas antarctica]MCG6201369.1 hypothetical protein [Psychromonas antarctica]
MNKLNTLLLVVICTLLNACGVEKKQPQMIIPQVQLDALDQAKNMQNELLRMQQQKEKTLREQGLL